MAAIRERREYLGLSQRAAAKLAGLHQSAWARIEAGRSSPSLVMLERMAAALGLEVTLRVAS